MNSVHAFEKHEGFLIIHITGTYDYWEFLKYPKIIRNQCIKDKKDKVLVDVSEMAFGKVPLIEQFFLSENLAEVFRNRIKIAVLWNGEYNSHFFQSVATNRSALLKMFRSYKKAEIWLLHDLENEPHNQ